MRNEPWDTLAWVCAVGIGSALANLIDLLPKNADYTPLSAWVWIVMFIVCSLAGGVFSALRDDR